VFGGTGFLGRRIVRHLRDRGFPVRIATRQPVRNRSDDPQIEPFRADIEDESSLAPAVAGMGGVVNAVSLYLECAPHTFHSVHVRAAANLAAEAVGPESGISCTFPGSERTLHRLLPTFAVAVKGSLRFKPLSPAPRLFALP
jgi:uncharacterized protein YbjT (DUF2867 family)